MDEDKSGDIHAPSSWMDMHQFIGDLITSGNASKEHPDVMNAVWGVSGGEASLQPPQQPRRVQDKAEAAGRKSKARNDHACTCPGCPYSSSPPPSFETLKPGVPSPLRSDKAGHAKDPCRPAPLNLCLPDTTDTSSASDLETSTSSCPQREKADETRQGSTQSSEPPTCRASTLNPLSLFPCFCCHRSLQSCAQILSQQGGADSRFSHTHAHHHFHHHHCPISSCLPCPPLTQSRPLQLSAPFPCLSCQRSFSACAQVCQQQHKQTHAAQEDEGGRATAPLLTEHPCMHCPATFSRPSQLLQHQRSEHAHKPTGFICTQCGRAFNSHSNLRIHLNVHTGARPYSCSECGKSFSQSGALKIHRRIHTGERPYSCGFCGRGFPHLAGVRAHQRTHTGEKPYRCSQCGKCFTQSGALKIHTRIHTGERPFICSICGKGFSNRSGIRFHYRTVHGLAPDHTGDEAEGAYRGPAGRGVSPGRPRTFPASTIRINASDNPDGNTYPVQTLREASSSTGAPPDYAPLAGNKSDVTNKGRSKEGLLYACEDCGLCFKDAPSRNRHQTVVHYSSEGRQEEGAQGKEISLSKL